MRWLKGETPDSSFERLRNALLTSSLKTRLMLGLIPPVIVLMTLTGYFTYMVSRQFINSALERSTLLETLSLRNEIEGLLDRLREQLIDLSSNTVHPEVLIRFLAKSAARRENDILGIVFLSRKNPDHLVYLANGTRIVQVQAESVRPNLLSALESFKNLEKEQVAISALLEMEFPFPEPENENQRITRQVFSLATPAFRYPEDRGFLLLLLDARRLRNILSLHNADDSPTRGFPRTAEARFFYFFDPEGWVLFESEPPGRADGELNTHQVRSRYPGTLGRKGQPFAFRPDSTCEEYWTMVEDVMRGKHGVVALAAPPSGAIGGSHFLAYAPVRFRQAAAAPTPIGGLAFRDVSRLSQAAGYRHIDLMLIITIGSALLVAGLIYWIGKILTRPILRLAEAVADLHEDMQPIRIGSRGKEIAILQQAINGLIADQQRHLEALQHKERALRDAGLKKEARIEPIDTAAADPVPAIVGRGPRVERLKAEIVKASQVDYDVLILGETGSGKQLAAEAIHRLSPRAAGPFVSINCGALDENLLLDTLFGHVRGAFTEAKADRKGAFLEADGGTLFLDEVQVASPRVQQALLRALAERKIKPLGSDRETTVDVRLIAASNADLEALIRRGEFREDLYFRLKVITLHTVPLREQRENISLLVRHFLDREERRTGRRGLGLSRGALAKLRRHHWPGNVRELQNCLMRAVVMAESALIQAEDIPLAVEGWEEDAENEATAAGEERRDEPSPMAAAGLNARQARAWPVILSEGRITRSRYQEIVGGNLPVRTAIYDLQDLVARGLLRKAGKGPATHYLPVPPRRRRTAA